MSLLLYAITTAPSAEHDTPHIVRVDVQGLAAWTRDVGAEPSPFTRDDLLKHHAVVAEVFERVEACLPVRFPTLVADEAALRSELESRREQLARQLEAVRGAAELAITAVWTTAEEAPRVQAATPGRRYLLERRAEMAGSDRRHAEAQRLADHLEREAGEALRQSERRVCPSREVGLSLALLIDRAEAEQLGTRLQAQPRPGVRILVHGPWPPYSFAQRGDGGA